MIPLSIYIWDFLNEKSCNMPYFEDDSTAFFCCFLRVTHWGRVSLHTTLATSGPTPKPWSTAVGAVLLPEVWYTDDHQQKHFHPTIYILLPNFCFSHAWLHVFLCVHVHIGGSPGQDSDKPGTSVADIQCALDNVGASELVIDLIVSTKNDRIFEESILLGIALLRGGNTQIQVYTGAVTHSQQGIHKIQMMLCLLAELFLPSAAQAEEVWEVLQGLLWPDGAGSERDPL